MKLLAELTSRRDVMVAELAHLVGHESPSADLPALSRAADAVAALGENYIGQAPERATVDGRPHLLWRFGTTTRVVLVGHLDTVWPMGTAAQWPFAVSDGRASGPGAFDMKAGLVQGFHGLSVLDDLEGVAVLVTADEEVGSHTSRRLIEDTARGAAMALVLEPSAGGALKTARKGVGMYEVIVSGRAAHAGLEPEKGVNALIELAHLVVVAEALGDVDAGTTVTPTVASAGTATNTVPEEARFKLDVRVLSDTEERRVDAALQGLVTRLPGSRVTVTGGPNRPPLPPSASAALFDRAQQLAGEIGLPPLAGVRVGGGSDGNFTAAIGVPTLDGLGAVGDGAHAAGEYVEIDSMAGRAALVSALVADGLGRA